MELTAEQKAMLHRNTITYPRVCPTHKDQVMWRYLFQDEWHCTKCDSEKWAEDAMQSFHSALARIHEQRTQSE